MGVRPQSLQPLSFALAWFALYSASGVPLASGFSPGWPHLHHSAAICRADLAPAAVTQIAMWSWSTLAGGLSARCAKAHTGDDPSHSAATDLA